MKRYRVLSFDIDSRAASINLEMQPSWEPQVKAQHRENYIQTVVGLVGEFGVVDGSNKIKNFIELENAPLSIIAFHNEFFRQVRKAFVIGAYYPALTAACSLGERILNHLMLRLRDYFSGTPEYKRVYDKDSFDNWNLAIDTLNSWEVLLPEVVDFYKRLAEVRNTKAIHFNPETDSNARGYALEAIGLLGEIIRLQFSGFGSQPWFISNIPGCSFIKKDCEGLPFVKSIYIDLRNCVLVGPHHKVEPIFDGTDYKLVVRDDYDYEPVEVTDDEFAALYKKATGKNDPADK